jgi:hypothetical protein
MLTRHTAWGDKELDANGPDQLASSSLSPQAVRIGPRYITASTERFELPLAP